MIARRRGNILYADRRLSEMVAHVSSTGAYITGFREPIQNNLFDRYAGRKRRNQIAVIRKEKIFILAE